MRVLLLSSAINSSLLGLREALERGSFVSHVGISTAHSETGADIVIALDQSATRFSAPRPRSAGNFTVNQHSGMIVTPTAVTVEMVVDMAEIPMFQTRSEIDTDHDKAISAGKAAAYRQRACADLSGGTELRLDGQVVPTTVVSSDLAFPPGQAGLATLRLTCGLTARPLQGSAGRLDFVNRNFTDRVGWREITAAGDGVRLLDSSVPARSTSVVLTRYPQDLLSSPLDQREAHLRVSGPGSAEGLAAAAADRPDSAARASAVRPNGPLARGSDRFTAAFTGLVARQRFTIWFGLMALVAAVALGAVHALAPGHGKTVMAAYLVGEHGSLRQAALLGLTVTSTHTAGVLVLGVLLSGSTAVVPERLYPWLGVTSGAMLAGVGPATPSGPLSPPAAPPTARRPTASCPPSGFRARPTPTAHRPAPQWLPPTSPGRSRCSSARGNTPLGAIERLLQTADPVGCGTASPTCHGRINIDRATTP